MSYNWDLFEALPTRRMHLDSTRNLPRDMGFRTQIWSRGRPSSLKHSPLSASPPLHKPSESMQLYRTGVFSEDHIAGNLNERLLMQGLNDRFAGFIDKVRQLEQQNQRLEAEIAALRERQSPEFGLAGVYEPEMSELRNFIVETENQKEQILLDQEQLKERLQQMKEKYEATAQIRLDTEASVQACKKEQENSNLMRVELESKAQCLTDEIAFLKSNHEQEVDDLFSQIQASQVSVEMKDFTKPDVAGALRAIRAQMEGFTSVNMQHAEDWFTSRVAKLSDAAAINKEALQSARQEISEYSRQLQSKNIELETLRGRKESLAKQLNDAEARHDGQLIQYQDAIQQLENDLKNTKQEMTLHLREYQDLLNVKMALDVEIASYRKLLEGEETRFDDFTPSAYTYKPQPLAHATYVTTKTKATSTKVMPQYRFVEEIISATTKEINMAELQAVIDQEEKTEGEANAEKKRDMEKEPGEPKEAAGEDEKECEEAEEVEEEGAKEVADKEEMEEEKEAEIKDDAEEKDEEKKEEEKVEVKDGEVEKAEEEVEVKDEENVEEVEEKVEGKDEQKVVEEKVEGKDEQKVVEEKVEGKDEQVTEEKVEGKDEQVEEEKVEGKDEQKVEEEKVEGKDEQKVEEEKVEGKDEQKVTEEKIEGKDEQKVEAEEKVEEKAEQKAVNEKAEMKDEEKFEDKSGEKFEEEKAEERKAAEVMDEEKVANGEEERENEVKVEEVVKAKEEIVKVKDGEKVKEKAEEKKGEKAEVKEEEKISKEKVEEKETGDSAVKGKEKVETKLKEKAEEAKEPGTEAVAKQGSSAVGEETQLADTIEPGTVKDKERKSIESDAKEEAASTEKGQGTV